MEFITGFFKQLSSFVWGPPMLALLVGTGIYLTVRLFGLQFRLLPYALKQAFIPHPPKDGVEEKGDISHFGALMTAMSATIGTGNIAGVATAVISGGAGAVFWMWITAIFGMATKYGEGVLAVKYRQVNDKGEMSGGPMYYIEYGLKKKWLGILFAFFAAVASFGIGSSVQSNSVAASIEASFGINPIITGIILTVLTAAVVLGGIKSIAKVSSVIVPAMAVIYILGGIWIIALNFNLVMPAIETILSSAFNTDAALGATLGMAVRYGVARGLFSNEAGMGSAPIAAAAAKTDHPVRQALVSMTGTFLDTIVVCSITGIVLVMGINTIGAGDLTGSALTTEMFNQLLPGPGGWIVTIGLVFFAYSTILGWSYYGEKCAEYLAGSKFVMAYRVIYVATVMMGCVVSLDFVWLMADVFNGLMAIPNLIALLLLTPVIVSETNDFLAKRKSGELR